MASVSSLTPSQFYLVAALLRCDSGCRMGANPFNRGDAVQLAAPKGKPDCVGFAA
jgi:hypothetical protein